MSQVYPVGSPDIIMVWPKGRPQVVAKPVGGYRVDVLPAERDSWWIEIHRKAVPSWSEEKLREWLARYRRLSLADGVLVAIDEETGAPVATAGSIDDSKDGMFPGGGQIAWVATAPAHRGRGLATWLSGLATNRVLSEGFGRVFLSTGDDLTAAIRVYLNLGYVPCLYAADQEVRWAKICEAVEHPFEPSTWPTRDDYLADGTSVK